MKPTKRKVRTDRIILMSVALILMIILGVLVVRLISHHNRSSSGSVVLNESIERSPLQKLEVQDLVGQNPDGEEITFDDSITKDDQGNYIPGTYQIPVYASQKKIGTVSVNIQAGESSSLTEANEDGLTIVNGILISNKKHPLPADYNPGDDPVAYEQVQKLIADMQSEGLSVSLNTSGFRDYAYQEQLYNGYVEQYGIAEADKISARPGYSEHQTGLTHDLIDLNGELITSEPEASWIREHCADYGFIVRYPQGKESITGYDYEPWHLRYVGNPAAQEIMSKGITLEEYLNVEGGDYTE